MPKILRNILSAIAAYIVIVICVLAGLGLAWMVLGGSGAFKGDSPEPSTAWLGAAIVTGFLAAVVGGLAARKLGSSAAAVKILAGLIVLLGLIAALTPKQLEEGADAASKPVAEMSFMEAGQYARQPTWYNWIVPILGVAGVLLGGRSAPATRDSG